jgi:beta-glucanase (GH16 family)
MSSPHPSRIERRRRPVSAVAVLVLIAACLTGLTTGRARADVPAPPAGWSTVWSDDFSGAAGTGLNGANWLYDTGTSYPGAAGNWGTGEVESMSASTANVYQDGSGHLAIKAIRDAAGNWTSGRVETQRTDFQPPAGGIMRVQASIQLPNVSGAGAQGYWPAFWMLGAPFRGVYTNWPSVGEIDIMESIDGQNTEHGTFHCGVDPGGPCNETSGISASTNASIWGQYHTYTLEWDRSVTPEALRWYLDGVNFATVTANQVDPTTWANATNHGFFVIFDLAMGGGWPGNPTGSTTSGGTMLVDYVAVYQSAGSGGGGGGGGGGGSAYGTIQAESDNAQSGTQTETTTDTGGGQDVGYIANGDWLEYDNVDFGSTAAAQFKARVASGAAGGVSGLVEVRLDSRSNAPIGSFAVGNTGGWQNWQTVPANISGVTGKHTVYLTFTSGQPADFVNVNWFTFTH